MDGFWFLFPVILFFAFGPFSRRWRNRHRDATGDFEYSGRDRNDPRRTREREEDDRRREDQVQLLETRVAELESRLDYAERLLTQRRESQPLPQHLDRE